MARAYASARTANTHSDPVWDVHLGVEVARLESIEGIGEVTLLTGRGGRLALSDGAKLAFFDVRLAA
jgi:hypothetical protein